MAAVRHLTESHVRRQKRLRSLHKRPLSVLRLPLYNCTVSFFYLHLERLVSAEHSIITIVLQCKLDDVARVLFVLIHSFSTRVSIHSDYTLDYACFDPSSLHEEKNILLKL